MEFSKCSVVFGRYLTLLRVGIIALGIQISFTDFAFANSEVLLVKLVPPTKEGDPSELRLVLDDQFRLVSFRYYMRTDSKKPLALYKEIPIGDLPSNPVMLHEKGLDIMKLESHDLTPQSGGHITYHYLLDGLESHTQFGAFVMELVFDSGSGPQGSWKVITQDNKEFKQLDIFMRRRVFVVGIDHVAPLLESSTK